MALLEQLLVVVRDAEPWLQYNYDAFGALWCKKRQVWCLRSARTNKGSQRKAFEKDESSSDEEGIIPEDAECLTNGSISSTSSVGALGLSQCIS